MSKRRGIDELCTADNRKRQDAPASRATEFTAHLRALNDQFAEWVHEQATSNSDQLWFAGVKDYVRYAEKLLDDFEDVLKNGRNQSPAAAINMFGTPAAAPAALGISGVHPGRSAGTPAGGRKSVSFVVTPAFGDAADAAALTPGGATDTNATASAGHTPATASGLGFDFGIGAGPAAAAADAVQGSSSCGVFTWGSSTPTAAGGSPVDGTAPVTGFMFGMGTPGKPEGQLGKSASETPAKLLTLVTNNSSTPAAGGGTDAVAASMPSASPCTSSAEGFRFCTSCPASTRAAPGTAAGSGTSVSTFSFGALPSTSPAAATSSPMFSFAGNGAAAVAGTPGNSAFKFPPPAATGDGIGCGGDDDGADEEAPARYKPEITVDENTWNVLFNSKARLHVRRVKEGKSEWSSKGVGVLTVRQRRDGSDSSTYVTFTNDGGRQLVSSRLQKTTEVHIVPEQSKKCRISLTVIHYDLPPAGAAGSDAATAAATTNRYSVEVCMVSLSSAEKMLELQQAVNQHRPK